MNLLIKIFIILILLPGRTFSQSDEKFQRYEFSHKSMGTIFRIICYTNQEDIAKQKSVEAFNRIDQLNYIMSDYLPDSELNRLSRSSGSGEYIQISPDLLKVIKTGQHWAIKTNGIFDITIGPYSQLWRRAGRKDRLPTPEQINNASECVGYNNIHIDPDNGKVMLGKKGMQLDLGGIAKGYAVDEMFNIFKNAGINRLLVDGGGDIRTGEAPPGKKGWKLVLENLQEDNQVIYATNTSIATSGDLYRYVLIDSVKYGHIIDPRTGYGMTTPRTVTIQASNCMEADILASTISILGAKDGSGFLHETPDVKAIIVEEEGGKLRRHEIGELDFLK
jgi:thiamine biosynthesis lipoprotein